MLLCQTQTWSLLLLAACANLPQPPGALSLLSPVSPGPVPLQDAAHGEPTPGHI